MDECDEVAVPTCTLPSVSNLLFQHLLSIACKKAD